MILVQSWYGLGMVLKWFGYYVGMTLGRFWYDSFDVGMILAWFVYDFGTASECVWLFLLAGMIQV
jgi:hypothetical protein